MDSCLFDLTTVTDLKFGSGKCSFFRTLQLLTRTKRRPHQSALPCHTLKRLWFDLLDAVPAIMICICPDLGLRTGPVPPAAVSSDGPHIENDVAHISAPKPPSEHVMMQIACLRFTCVSSYIISINAALRSFCMSCSPLGYDHHLTIVDRNNQPNHCILMRD